MNHQLNQQDMQPGTGTPWIELCIGWTLGLMVSPATLIPVMLSGIASIMAIYKSYLEIRKMKNKK